MIFVTVGTFHYGFARLLKKVDKLARDKVINDFFVQTGHTNYQPKYCAYVQFVEDSKFQNLIKKSAIIIAHAGAGTIMNALSHNKPTIVVPRLKKFREHFNDHQLQLTKELEKEGRIIAVYDIENLEEAIKKAKNFNPEIIKNESKIIELIEDYLNKNGLI